MGLFNRTPSATLVGEELFTAISALEHSIEHLQQMPLDTGRASALKRRQALAQRLRRAL